MRYFRGILTFVKEMMGIIVILLAVAYVSFMIFYYSYPSQQISGVVAEVSYSVSGSSGFFSSPTKQTFIKFEDGRIKVFNNINTDNILEEGKFNIISYNNAGGIVCVKIK